MDTINYTEQEESDIVEFFMLHEDDRDERLKAHYRQGKIVDGKWVNYKEEEEEEEPYCFKDTTIDTVENDICFCSVCSCVKPTEFKVLVTVRV